MAATQLQLPANANLAEAARLAQALQAEIGAGNGTVTVDAGALEVYDTSTVALLLQLRRVAQEAGRPFELRAVPPKLVQLAQLYGVDELLCTAGADGSGGTPASATA